MGDRITVKVTVDTDELRKWADHHADRGNHGVAHVLYKAASDGESLGEQAIREAKVEALREAASHFERDMATAWGGDTSWLTTGGNIGRLVADILCERANEIGDPA